MSESDEFVIKGFTTKVIHEAHDVHQWSHLELVPPIVASTTFYQPDPTDAAMFSYGRGRNPTRDVLDRNLAALDNGKYGLTFSSGSAATSTVIHLLKSGDHIISCSETYGGTRTMFNHFIEMQNIEITYVDGTDTNLVGEAIRKNTKLIWLESPTNPCMKICDIKAICESAHSHSEANILVAVDNTYLTPYFQRPLDLGADIVMYSLSKYMNGHNDVIMGALIVNDKDLYDQLRFIQIKYGPIPSPFDCFLVLRGLKTLPLRMERHYKNGLAIAQYLEVHPNVVQVFHPGLPSHKQYAVAIRQSSGQCGMVAFQLKGSLEEAKTFVKSLRVILSSGSLGSYGSLAEIPVCMSHSNMPKNVRDELEIFDSTVRLSVGLEDVDDLIADLEQAFRKTYN